MFGLAGAVIVRGPVVKHRPAPEGGQGQGQQARLPALRLQPRRRQLPVCTRSICTVNDWCLF